MKTYSHPPRVGICVLNWNSGRALLDCVSNLKRQHSDDFSHLIVVDNDSSDDSLQSVRTEWPDLTIIRNANNLGYSAGNNVGAARLMELGCDYLVFLNPDVLALPGTIRCLVESLIANPKAGCAGGVPLTPSGQSRVTARNRPSVLQKIVLYGPLHRIPTLRQICRTHQKFAGDLTEGEVVYCVCGACIAFSSSAFHRIGGFDEKLFLYEEEFVIAERLRSLDRQVIVSTKAFYSHQEASSTRNIPYRRRLHFYASEHYFLRHYYHWNPLLCWALRAYRLVEWCGYSAHWWLTRSVSRPQSSC